MLHFARWSHDRSRARYFSDKAPLSSTVENDIRITFHLRVARDEKRRLDIATGYQRANLRSRPAESGKTRRENVDSARARARARVFEGLFKGVLDPPIYLSE